MIIFTVKRNERDEFLVLIYTSSLHENSQKALRANVFCVELRTE